MLDVLAREWADGSMRFASPGEALFAARDGCGPLLGIGGITRDPHAADTLRMRRFYVAPAVRGAGIGRCLAAAAIRHAGGARTRLRAPVTAFAFWERLGFRPIPRDAEATHEFNPAGRAPPAL